MLADMIELADVTGCRTYIKCVICGDGTLIRIHYIVSSQRVSISGGLAASHTVFPSSAWKRLVFSPNMLSVGSGEQVSITVNRIVSSLLILCLMITSMTVPFISPIVSSSSKETLCKFDEPDKSQKRETTIVTNLNVF